MVVPLLTHSFAQKLFGYCRLRNSNYRGSTNTEPGAVATGLYLR